MLSLRKAKAISWGLLLLGVTASLLVYIGGAVVVSLGHPWAGPFKIMQDTFSTAMGWGAVSILPGLAGLTITSLYQVVRAAKD